MERQAVDAVMERAGSGSIGECVGSKREACGRVRVLGIGRRSCTIVVLYSFLFVPGIHHWHHVYLSSCSDISLCSISRVEFPHGLPLPLSLISSGHTMRVSYSVTVTSALGVWYNVLYRNINRYNVYTKLQIHVSMNHLHIQAAIRLRFQ